MRTAAATLVWLVVSTSSYGALFPTPLHFVRRIEDPIARTIVTVDEYCDGDRIVTVNGPRVAIADFGAQLLTEIDHAKAVYSITPFAGIAQARAAAPQSTSSVKVEIDRSVALSREAVEALVGASYPNTRNTEHDRILAKAAPARGHIAAQSTDAQPYGLPSSTAITFENGLTYRNVVVRVDHDRAPAQLMLIDAGATRVESRLTRTSRELRQLDQRPKE